MIALGLASYPRRKHQNCIVTKRLNMKIVNTLWAFYSLYLKF